MTNRLDLRKLAKVLALADSAHAGEAATALRTADRLLKSGGKTWGEFAKLVLAGGTSPSKAQAASERTLVGRCYWARFAGAGNVCGDELA